MVQSLVQCLKWIKAKIGLDVVLKRKKNLIAYIHRWSRGFVHLPDFIYRCRVILSLDGLRD